MQNIGVFICCCQNEIGGVVDVERVVGEVGRLAPVSVATAHDFWCSEAGQKVMKAVMEEKGLEGVVVAACSPPLHELTFRNAAESAGLASEGCVIADIREGCSYVHSDSEEATGRAVEIIKERVEQLASQEQSLPIDRSMVKKALVIGGGIAGIQAALDIANSGYEVILVEREPSIGGHMIQLSETFPTLDCSQCILTPKMVETGQHPKITLLTYSEVDDVKGQMGHFRVTIRRKAAYVDWDRCTGCGVCSEKCPKKVPSEFDRFMGLRKAIYTPFPQAVPSKPVIDRKHCIFFQKGKCKVCEKFCDVGAICWEQEDEILEQEVGAIVVATGYDLYPMVKLGEYGGGQIENVIDGFAFERLLYASGPTGGEVRRPSDGKVPKEVVFIQCAGSRDPEKNMPYCSKICCMYTTKHAMLYKHRVHDGQPYVFYIDVRTAGKGYEEFYHRAAEEEDVIFLRGKVSKVFEQDGKVIVWGADTLTGRKIEIAADLVVLAMAMVPSEGTAELLRKLNIPSDGDGFLSEAHSKLRPVESRTPGYFLAGCAQGPKDIPEAVAQASGAASKVIGLFSREKP
ncbi:MAG: FAD-dependent oxidoreductase [bacterium]